MQKIQQKQKTKNELVSIIMPCHNGSDTIKESINSVLNQTYSNWELLIIDDNSSDKSKEVIEYFCKKDKRIKLLENATPSGLPATARNVGIKAANGRYIAFLDCDDIWLPAKLANQLHLFTLQNVAVVFSYYAKMDFCGQFWNAIIKSPFVVNYKRLLRGDCIGNLTGIYDTKKCGKVFQKEIHSEDYLMYLMILRQGFCAVNTNTIEGFYRVGRTSVSCNKLRTYKWHWHILKNEMHLPFFVAVLNFSFYAIKGLLKLLSKDRCAKKPQKILPLNIGGGGGITP